MWVLLATNLTQAAIRPTQLPDFLSMTDLAIDGPGWFAVRDESSDRILLTRFGSFRVNSEGFLVQGSGLRVQGWMGEDPSQLGDLRIHAEQGLRHFRFDPDGRLHLELLSGEARTGGRFALVRVPAGTSLNPEGNYLFAAEKGSCEWQAPGRGGLGLLKPGFIEEADTVRVRAAEVKDPKTLGPWRQRTGIPSHLAVHGSGCFLVRDPQSGQRYLTRAGAFRRDTQGHLVTPTGLRLQGISGFDASVVHDLSIDDGAPTKAEPAAPTYGYAIDPAGWIDVRLTDGNEYRCLRINLYQSPAAVGTVPPGLSLIQAPPGVELIRATEGSWIESGALDLAEFDAALLDLCKTQRHCFQGALDRTGIRSDLSISGPGMFLLRDQETGELAATRCGTFELDPDGYLVLVGRFRLQAETPVGSPVLGDLQLDLTGGSPSSSTQANAIDFQVDFGGEVRVRRADGTSFPCSRILLQQFLEPDRLTVLATNVYDRTRPRLLQWEAGLQVELHGRGDRVYGNLDAAAPRPLRPAAPETASLGMVLSGALEIPMAPELRWLQPPQAGRWLIVEPPTLPSRASLFAVEGSSDFQRWSKLGIVEMSDRGLRFHVPAADGAGCSFFRLSEALPSTAALP